MRPKGYKEKLERQVEAFNLKYPIGTDVVYFPLRDRNGLGGQACRTKTFSAAEILGGHSAVIWVEKKRGCVGLDWIVPRAELSLAKIQFDEHFNHLWDLAEVVAEDT